MLLIPRPRPICNDWDFWCADDRMLDQVCSEARGAGSLASCANGFPNCIEGAVLVAKETFISRVEKLGASSGKGDESPVDCDGRSGED